MQGAQSSSGGQSVNITLPDGAVRTYGAGVTGMEIAESISKSLAKAVIAVRINGEISDLSLPIERDASISLVKREDEAEGRKRSHKRASDVQADTLRYQS